MKLLKLTETKNINCYLTDQLNLFQLVAKALFLIFI